MDIKKAYIERQAELFEVNADIIQTEQALKSKATDYVITARYLENLRAHERSLRG